MCQGKKYKKKNRSNKRKERRGGQKSDEKEIGKCKKALLRSDGGGGLEKKDLGV